MGNPVHSHHGSSTIETLETASPIDAWLSPKRQIPLSKSLFLQPRRYSLAWFQLQAEILLLPLFAQLRRVRLLATRRLRVWQRRKNSRQAVNRYLDKQLERCPLPDFSEDAYSPGDFDADDASLTTLFQTKQSKPPSDEALSATAPQKEVTQPVRQSAPPLYPGEAVEAAMKPVLSVLAETLQAIATEAQAPSEASEAVYKGTVPAATSAPVAITTTTTCREEEQQAETLAPLSSLTALATQEQLLPALSVEAAPLKASEPKGYTSAPPRLDLLPPDPLHAIKQLQQRRIQQMAHRNKQISHNLNSLVDQYFSTEGLTQPTEAPAPSD